MPEARADIRITGKDQASGEIRKATASVRELNQESGKLRRSVQVPRTGQFYGAEDRRLMQSMAASMREVDTGAGMARKTIAGMEEESKRLSGQLNNLQYGTAAFTSKAAELRTVNTELAKMRQHAQVLTGKSGLRAAAEGVAGRFGLSLGAGLIAGGAALATTAIIGIGGESLKAAASLEQLEQKAKVVFGDTFSEVNAEAAKFSASVGRARSDVLQFATDLGALMESNDITGDTLSELSTELSKLAIDLSSFFDTSETEAFNALRSGLVGMVMPMRRFGVDMTDAAMKAFVLQKGLRQTWEEMSTGQKMAVRYAFVMEKTGKAQGDAARTADQLSNQYRRLQGNVKTALENLGKNLAPAATLSLQGMNAALENSPSLFETMATAAAGAYGPLVKLAIAAANVRASLMETKSYAKEGLQFGVSLPNVTDLSDEDLKKMQEAGVESKKLQEMLDQIGGGPDSSGDNAADGLKRVRESLEDLARSARRETAEIAMRMIELDREHAKAMEDIRKDMDQTAAKILDLGKKFDKLAEDWKRSVDKMNTATADLLIDADENISGKQGRLTELDRQIESLKQQGNASIPVALQEERDKLAEELAREQAGRANVAAKVGVGAGLTEEARKNLEEDLAAEMKKIAEYEATRKKLIGGNASVPLSNTQQLELHRARADDIRKQLGASGSDADRIYQERSGQTETERRFDDMQKDQAERKQDHEERQAELNEENDKLKQTMQTLSDKAQKEKESYQESRTQMKLTQEAMREFEANITEAFINIDEATEETVKTLTENFSLLKEGIEEWNALLQSNPEAAQAAGSNSLAESVAQRRAERKIDSALEPSGTQVNIGPFYVSEKVDVNDVVRQITRAIQLQQQQSSPS